MKILIIQTASIGDVILATAVLEELHDAYPSAEIDLLVKKGMESLFQAHPFIQKLIVWDKKNKYRDILRILREVRKTRYDMVINLQRFALTGLITALSGARETVGFTKNPLAFLFTRRIKHIIKKGIHEVERNRSLIIPVLPANHKNNLSGFIQGPKLYPSPSDEARVEALKTRVEALEAKVSALKARPYVSISPASLWFTKQYPASKWVELIQTLPEEIDIYLLGSPADFPLCETIKNLSSRAKLSSLAGSLSFLESAALMRDALMNYTNDSAPMHLASAVNAPVTAVYCSTVPEFGFGPLSDKKWIIQSRKQLSCRPCGLHGKTECPLGHFECALTINVSQFAKHE